jgi:hypothetical protein
VDIGKFGRGKAMELLAGANDYKVDLLCSHEGVGEFVKRTSARILYSATLAREARWALRSPDIVSVSYLHGDLAVIVCGTYVLYDIMMLRTCNIGHRTPGLSRPRSSPLPAHLPNSPETAPIALVRVLWLDEELEYVTARPNAS